MSQTIAVMMIILAMIALNFGSALGQIEETATSAGDDEHTATPTPTSTETSTGTATGSETPTLTEIAPSTPTPTETTTLFPTTRATPTVTRTASYDQVYGALPPDPVLEDPHMPGELVVKLKTQGLDFSAALPGIPLRSMEELSLPLTYLLKIPDRYLTAALELLDSHPQVAYAEPNFLAQTLEVIPNDPWYPDEWGLRAIGATAAWEISTGTAGVTIAIVDTGVAFSHPDLAGKLIAGYDFVNDDTSADDDNGHGTHVAGIAAAISNNGAGVSGVSWGAMIMPVKCLAHDGYGSYADVANGIMYAADNGADIINLSLGGSGTSATLQSAVEYAYAHGAVLVGASGNTGSSVVDIPARYPEVIAVSAMTSSYQVAGFSNYGAEVDFTAPGVSILSTYPASTVAYDSGTSMAAPFVSGAIAVIMDATGITSPMGIYWLLADNARDISPAGWDARSGYGLVRLDYALGIEPPTPTPTQAPEEEESPPTQVVYGSSGRVLFSTTPTTTLTLTVTHTRTGGQGTPTTTVTVTPTHTHTATPTPTQVGDADNPPFDVSVLVPCYGIAIILAGVAMFIYAWRLKRSTRAEEKP
ncbi:MAG: peptidase S8 [Anaerolineae bacterium]|nr:peptidase S8 [Anaerolineae bacterium]